ncbi:MAG TPA: primosomal protein N', partial [Candidatus Binatia bacterium]
MLEPQKFARVVIPSRLKHPLVYAIPTALLDRIAPGMRVLIPLQKRTMTGVVWEIIEQSSLLEVKQILAVMDDLTILDVDLLKLAQWISQYYLAPLGEVLGTMLPPNSRRESQRTVRLQANHPPVGDELEQKIVQFVHQRKGKITVKLLTRQFPEQNIESLITRLELQGVIDIEDHLAKQRQKPHAAPNSVRSAAVSAGNRFQLTAEQDLALRPIAQQLEQNSFMTFLLHGVTGSGKTEVYLRAIEHARSLGRSSLVLIPEISLTPQLLDRVTARFPGKVGVLHSALTAAERWAQWWHIANGNVDVVVGARSAVFAPLPKLGLIVVDEEHDSSYKQEDSLRYNGRDVAVVRGKLQGCPVILGSATPALESYENCRQGRYQLLEITKRVEKRPLPTIELCDLRTQYRSPDSAKRTPHKGSIVAAKDNDQPLMSKLFIEALQQNFSAKRQTLIFLNRRGFANFLQCTSCGYVWRCPHCSVTLTLHLKHKQLSCHHCDYRRPTTNVCPECKNESLTAIGAGTEQIEATLQQIVPDARIARMDRDTTGRRGSHEALIRGWEKGEID